MINHESKNSENLRHPFLIVETNDNDFISEAYENRQCIVYDINNRFKYASWVLLKGAYEIPWSKKEDNYDLQI